MHKKVPVKASSCAASQGFCAGCKGSLDAEYKELLHQLNDLERLFAENAKRFRDRECVHSRLLKDYIEGNVSIIFDLCVHTDWNHNRQRFGRITPRHTFNHLARLSFQHSAGYSRYAGQRNQEFVLIPDVHVVNGADEMIPSFAVWSEIIDNEVEKVRADGVYLHAPQCAFQIPSIGVDGEFGMRFLSKARREGREQRKPTVVGGGLEVVYSIPDYKRKIVKRNGILEVVFENLISSLRIDLTQNTLGFARIVSRNYSVYIRDMFVGPFNLEASTFESNHIEQ